MSVNFTYTYVYVLHDTLIMKLAINIYLVYVYSLNCLFVHKYDIYAYIGVACNIQHTIL